MRPAGSYKGKNGRYLSLIAAYIAVQKGSVIGETSLYAQQVTLMEIEEKKRKAKPSTNFCPRKAAIKETQQTPCFSSGEGSCDYTNDRRKSGK
jgi:hypothetical protein